MTAGINNRAYGKSIGRLVLRKVILEDWALKLVALGITLGLWLAVTGLSTPTRERLTVRLDLIISSNSQITNSPQQEVQIEISGDKRKLDQINRGDLAAVRDLSTLAAGDWVVPLSAEDVSIPLPQGVKLVDVQPSRIPVKIENVAERDLEVRAATAGEVATGYEVYMATPRPPSIRVRGPASVVNALDSVATDQIDVSGRREDFTARQVAVRVANPQAVVLNTVVDVTFRIGERRIERFFAVPVSGVPARIASFYAFGPGSLLQKRKAEEFKVELFMSGSGETSPRVILPDDLADVVEIRRLTIRP